MKCLAAKNLEAHLFFTHSQSHALNANASFLPLTCPSLTHTPSHAGERFCDELGKRDYVSGRMFMNEAPFYLVLNSAAAASILWHCEHYRSRGVMEMFTGKSEMCCACS